MYFGAYTSASMIECHFPASNASFACRATNALPFYSSVAALVATVTILTAATADPNAWSEERKAAFLLLSRKNLPIVLF